jgi:hypothetical protein
VQLNAGIVLPAVKQVYIQHVLLLSSRSAVSVHELFFRELFQRSGSCDEERQRP